MPDGTVSFYKRHIEPNLISSCIKCHDSRSHTMPLSKRSFGQIIPRRMSQQNLHFVMEHLNRADPFESSILKMATTAHGDQKSASFAASDAFVFELKKWSVAVSNDPARWLMDLASKPEPETQEQKLPQSTAESFNADSIEDPATISNEIIEVEAPIEQVEQPDVDPYDPAAFNRK